MSTNSSKHPSEPDSDSIEENTLDAETAERLWGFYFQRMVGIARQQLRGTHRSARDEEDIALSAFKSFCLGLRKGRFQIEDGEANLWPLLVTITLRKAVDQIRYENRQKRRVPANQCSNEISDTTTRSIELDQITASEPTAEQIVASTEVFERVLDKLDQSGDDALRQIALRSLEGESPKEIAVSLDCTPRTIQRKLKTVAAIWEQDHE